MRLTNNKGLAAGFQAGLDACLKPGADVIVNTDADNQYCGSEIAKLVEPILDGRADMVVGSREVQDDRAFLRRARSCCSGSGAGWCDVSPGPRSPTPPRASAPTTARRHCVQLQVVYNFTYTLESLIQAGKMLVAVDEVPIRTNPQTRESRLFASTGSYVRRNGLAILRI